MSYGVKLVEEGTSEAAPLASLADMKDLEGFEMQFANGEMVNAKCEWYVHCHQFHITKIAAYVPLEDGVDKSFIHFRKTYRA